MLSVLLLTLSACNHSDNHDYSSPYDVFWGTNDCSISGQNRFVHDVMSQWYLWNDTLPTLDPATFSSPEALLDALTINAPVVDQFSYIDDHAASDAFFVDGQFTGLGFTSRVLDNRLFLALVFSGSPANNAGLSRGFEIITVNGVDVASTLAAGNSLDFGVNEVGVAVDIEYADLSGTTATTTVTKGIVSINTVPTSSVIDNNGVATGYLHFYSFIKPSVEALDLAFSQFEAANVTELVVDVRYNSGGLLSVARYLSGLIGGTTTANQVMTKLLHNADRAAANNVSAFFPDPIHGLDLSRVVFITSGSSASTSELVINSLSPFLDVVLVGDTTFGKPVGAYGFYFCSSVLFPVSFELTNALDEGQYFGGLAVDCPAADDLGTPLGDVTEASLAEALSYLDTGACTPAVAGSSPLISKPTLIDKTDTPSVEIIKPWKVFDAH